MSQTRKDNENISETEYSCKLLGGPLNGEGGELGSTSLLFLPKITYKNGSFMLKLYGRFSKDP